MSSTDKKIYFTIRLGQGGFTDDRSPIGKLGGRQLTLDIKPRTFPIAISISNEYYTNSADPTHSYEIAGLIAANFLYYQTIIQITPALVNKIFEILFPLSIISLSATVIKFPCWTTILPLTIVIST